MAGLHYEIALIEECRSLLAERMQACIDKRTEIVGKIEQLGDAGEGPGADSMALWKQIREIRKVMDEIATEEEWLETQVAGRKDILKARQQLVAL